MDLAQFLFYYQGSAKDTTVQHSDKKSSHQTVLHNKEMPTHSAEECSVPNNMKCD
jgi:hypothetical protein